MSETKWAIEIGSRVHFVYGGQHVPAIVTDPAFQDHGIDGQDEVRIIQALTVFPPNAEPFTTVAAHADGAASINTTWHWPEWTPVFYGDSDGGIIVEGEFCEVSDVPTVSRVGDQVLYVLDSGPYAGEARSATVVKVWDAMAGYVNLVVLLDGGNDDPTAPYPVPLLRWVTSVRFDPDKAKRTWHWPE